MSASRNKLTRTFASVAVGLTALCVMASHAHEGHEAMDEPRAVIGGNLGEIHWKPMFDGTWEGWLHPVRGLGLQNVRTTPDGWEVDEENALIGKQDSGEGKLAFGDLSWSNVELSARITPLTGGNAQMFFRMDDEGNGYVFDLMLGWEVAAIHKVTRYGSNDIEIVKLSAVNFPVERGREYEVMIAARGHSITSYIDGALVNQLTDDTWPNGRVGLILWKAKTRYADLRYRRLDE